MRTLIIVLALPLAAVAAPKPVVLQDIPHIRQRPDFCGEACVAMALQKLGKSWTQDDVFNASGLDPLKGRGCYTRELQAAIKAIGFDPGQTWYRTTPARSAKALDTLWAEVVSDLERDIPNVLCMQYDQSPNTTEHFRLIVGYDAKTDEVIYHEPAEDNGAYRRMKRSTLFKLWPLKYRKDSWTMVRMRLAPQKLRAAITKPHSDADYAQHVMKLKKRLPSKDFNIVIQPPFVVVGDESEKMVKLRAESTINKSVIALKKAYFKKNPSRILDVWLFKDKKSYEKHTKRLWGEVPDTPYGYYSETHSALVMNISTGGGTLVHELVHPFIESNFPACPAWFNEGLASLYEQSTRRGGDIYGLTNWRLKGLQTAIKRKSAPAFETTMATSQFQFYNRDPGTNYSQSRYLCYYLQQKKLLRTYYHQFVLNHKSDPTGVKTLKKVLKTDDLKAFQQDWEKWVLTLRFP
jgi:hypothetical protein